MKQVRQFFSYCSEPWPPISKLRLVIRFWFPFSPPRPPGVVSALQPRRPRSGGPPILWKSRPQ